MPPLSGARDIEQALSAVGELVAAVGEQYAIVIVGGAALNLLGVVARSTRDVDVLAFAEPAAGRGARKLVRPPEPMPAPLVHAIRTVARDFGLVEGWLNTDPSLQWNAGLPPGLASRVHWRNYAGLRVGIVDRLDLIWLKLFAAADQGGRHARDLVALAPSDEELSLAARWVKTQDENKREFPAIVDEVVNYVRKHRDVADR